MIIFNRLSEPVCTKKNVKSRIVIVNCKIYFGVLQNVIDNKALFDA